MSHLPQDWHYPQHEKKKNSGSDRMPCKFSLVFKNFKASISKRNSWPFGEIEVKQEEG